MNTGADSKNKGKRRTTKPTTTTEIDRWSKNWIAQTQKDDKRKHGEKRSQRRIIHDLIEFYENHRHHCEFSSSPNAATTLRAVAL